jgi:rhodanese-related sulfurtransferase
MPFTKEEVRDKMAEKDVVILSVLPQEDFEKLHITGSRSLPLTLDYGAFLHEIEKKYGKEMFFITYGNHWTRADGASAAQAMKVQGFKAENYPGGIREWYDAGFPTEGTEMLRSA